MMHGVYVVATGAGQYYCDTSLPPDIADSPDLAVITGDGAAFTSPNGWSVVSGTVVANANPRPVAAPQPIYIPAALIRTRLQADGKWDAAVSAMTTAQQLEFCTLECGVLPGDADVIALLDAIGANVSVILEIPT